MIIRGAQLTANVKGQYFNILQKLKISLVLCTVTTTQDSLATILFILLAA